MFHAAMTWNDSNLISRSLFSHQTLSTLPNAIFLPKTCSLAFHWAHNIYDMNCGYTGVRDIHFYAQLRRFSRGTTLEPGPCRSLWSSLKSNLMRNIRINWKQPQKITSNIFKLCHISVSSSAWLRSLSSLWHEIHGLERQQDIVGKLGNVDNLACSICKHICVYIILYRPTIYTHVCVVSMYA